MAGRSDRRRVGDLTSECDWGRPDNQINACCVFCCTAQPPPPSDRLRRLVETWFSTTLVPPPSALPRRRPLRSEYRPQCAQQDPGTCCRPPSGSGNWRALTNQSVRQSCPRWRGGRSGNTKPAPCREAVAFRDVEAGLDGDHVPRDERRAARDTRCVVHVQAQEVACGMRIQAIVELENKKKR